MGAKQANTGIIYRDTGERGDCWSWLGIDADTKLVIAWYTGGRNFGAALFFVEDLQQRLSERVQLSTDGLNLYNNSIPLVFGDTVDFGQIIKLYEHKPSGKYSQPRCVGTRKRVRCGNPDRDLISTSYVERQNLTVRMSCRRFTRLTNAFSKKVENHKHALAINFMYYNYCRVHQTLRITPAMASGLTDHVWEVSELVDLIR